MTQGKKNFRDEYGDAIDLPLNAIAYELTSGGTDLPDSLADLRHAVIKEARKYDLTDWQIAKGARLLDRWWRNATRGADDA